MNFEQIHKVYLIGIGGIGMSALARYFRNQQKLVAGFDRTESALTLSLTAEGMEIHYSDQISLIPEPFKTPGDTLVVYTPAVASDHSELSWFRQHGFEIRKRAEVLGLISRSKNVIGIAGTHGKTTTSTMVAHLLQSSPQGCNAFLGGISLNYNSNLLLSSKSDYLVVEADEYDRSFLHLNPAASIVTSMDADHLDIYGSHEEYCNAFYRYISQIHEGGFLVIKKDLEPVKPSGSIRIYTYSLKGQSDFHAQNISVRNGFYSFDVVTPQRVIENVKLGFPGLLNVENAVAAIAMAVLLGLEDDKIREAMESFRGVKRRFEYYLKSEQLTFIDDYGHHPQELKFTIESVRELFPGKKITGIFQPHLYSRTRDFAGDFAASLSLLDELLLLDIYPAREAPIPGVTSQMLLEKVQIAQKQTCSKNELITILDNKPLPEVLITMGAGDIDTLTEPIRQLMIRKLNAIGSKEGKGNS